MLEAGSQGLNYRSHAYRDNVNLDTVERWFAQEKYGLKGLEGFEKDSVQNSKEEIIAELEESVDIDTLELVAQDRYETSREHIGNTEFLFINDGNRYEHFSEKTNTIGLCEAKPVEKTLDGLKPATEESELRLNMVRDYLNLVG